MDSRPKSADGQGSNRSRDQPQENHGRDEFQAQKDSEIDLEDDSFVPITMSTDTDDDDDTHERDDANDHLPSKEILGNEDDLVEHFDSFVRQKKRAVPVWDEAKIDLLPADLRPAIRTITAKIRRWQSRNPTGLARREMDILIEQLNVFLELQPSRNDPSYERQCQVWLFDLYGRTIDAQKAAIALRNEAIPKSLDEYMDTPPFHLPKH